MRRRDVPLTAALIALLVVAAAVMFWTDIKNSSPSS
jgi:phosphotransferase system  glucose/maltose/N-acetylglucosamine-specific IIC component